MNEKKQFYGKTLGPWIPIIVMIVGMIASVILGSGGLLRFSLFGFFGRVVGLFLAKDKKHYGDILMAGLQNHMLAVIIMAFLLAGVLSQLLKMSGLINGLIWAMSILHLPTGFIPVIAFLTCVLISTACGTSSGSVTAVAPVLVPLAASLDCNVGLVCGAIISGAIFGDNLAPISDTTIGSALTQEAKINEVVATRLPYSLIAGAISAVLFIIMGLSTTVEQAANIQMDSSDAKALVLLIIPIIMIVMMKKGWGLVPTLLICNVTGILINLILGCISVETMLSETGPILAGMTGMLNIILFIMLLFGILEILNQTGSFDKLLNGLVKICKTPRSAELVCMLASAIGSLASGGSSTAVMFFGPMVKEIMRKFKIDRNRGANFLDATACAVTGLMPYGTPCMLAISFAVQCEGVSPAFSFKDIMPYNYHCIFLFLIFLLSAITGIGRKYEKEASALDSSEA